MKKRNRRIKLNLNFIDKAVEYVSPVHARKRMYARAVMAYAGGYIGGRKDRRPTSEWKTSGGSADSDLLPDLSTLRERSRDSVRNNPLAAGVINTNVTNVVGTGLKLQSRIDRDVLNMTEDESDLWESKTEREYRLFADSLDCSVSRNMNFAAQQDLAFRQVLENGDVFCLLPRISRSGQPYSLRLQLVEADRVCNEKNARDTDKVSGGVEKDDYGAPDKYHISDQHPGNIHTAKSRTWTSVSAFGKETGLRNVIHLYRVLRPGQTRGVPYLAPVIETLKQLNRYTEAEIMAAVIAGMFTVFVKSETGEDFSPMEPTSETGGETSDDDYKLASGAIIGLAPGEDIQTANPGRPNQVFDPFMQAILRQVGVALEIPFEILIKHFTASYSAARAALLEAWKFFSSRRKWMADNFCQIIYEIWMYEAIARGRIVAPGYFTDPIIRKAYQGSEWVGPAKGMIDELKEVRAAGERIVIGLSTRAYETAQMTGQDQEKVHKQLVKENKMRQELIPDSLSKPDEDDDKIDDKGDKDNDEAA